EKITIGKINPDALSRIMEIQPLEQVEKDALIRLNYILGFIESKNQKNLEKFVVNLTEQYKKQITTNFAIESKFDFTKLFSNYKYLKKFSELTQALLNFYLQKLVIQKDDNWIKDKVKVKQGDYLRAFLLPRYNNLQALIEAIGREEAIKFYKQYVTHYIIDRKLDTENTFVDLPTMFEKRKQPTETPSEWEIVCGLLNEGKYFYRNNNCMWIDALVDYPDSEMKYLICCYGDYESARKFYHESIILTMEHTIAQGDKYCSRVLHDTRIDYDLRHPEKKFWDNL
ncbi:MAG: L-2-amino-thiazoline-4-carboxylic acid hydrolase, partial [Candidatus Heimdallarchaeota archaeon]